MKKLYKMLVLLLVGGPVLLSSCDPLSIRDYQMEPYTGAFTWEAVAKKAAWSNRYDHAAVAFRGKMWIFGGYDSGRTRGDTYLEDIWNSADGKDWTLVTDSAPWKGRRGHTVTVFNDGSGEALYLVGGFEVDEKTGYRQYTNDCWKSTDGIAWTRIKERTYPVNNMDSDFMPRFNHACVTATHGGINYLYLIGGATMLEEAVGAYSFYYFHDVWRSRNGIKWEKLDNNDFGQRSELAACVDPSSGRIYLHGGNHGVAFDNQNLYNHPVEYFYDLWYTDDGVNWKVDTTFSTLRAGHGLVFYNQSLWLLPGKVDNYEHLRYGEGETLMDLYYTYRRDDGGAWELDSKGSAFSGRHSYATVEFNGKIWVLGGETADNGPNNDVWCGSIN